MHLSNWASKTGQVGGCPARRNGPDLTDNNNLIELLPRKPPSLKENTGEEEQMSVVEGKRGKRGERMEEEKRKGRSCPFIPLK